MPLIYFLRHGQTDWNVQRRLQGHHDVPLNAVGRSQALRNGGVLAEMLSGESRFDFVSSPLLRARQTMEIVREAMGLPENGYRTDDRLQEIFFGAWGGLTMMEAQERDPDLYARRSADIWNVAPPEGEAFRDFYARVMDWLSEVKDDSIVVAHGGVSRCLRGHFLKLSPEEMMTLDVPQDKVLMIDGETLTWL
jgi:broad specificity phosphatase PhoE